MDFALGELMLAYFLDIYNGLGLFVFILMIGGVFFGFMGFGSGDYGMRVSLVCFLFSIICAVFLVFAPSKAFLSQFL